MMHVTHSPLALCNLLLCCIHTILICISSILLYFVVSIQCFIIIIFLFLNSGQWKELSKLEYEIAMDMFSWIMMHDKVIKIIFYYFCEKKIKDPSNRIP